MIGRPRNLRPFWSRREPSTPWLSPEDTYGESGPKPNTYPSGVGYVPGRGPHGPSSEHAGWCYCGYLAVQCDAYAEALRIYGQPAEVTGRPRRLRPFWSQLGRALASPTGRIADEAIAGWGRVLELGEQAAADLAAVRGQRDEAADALYDMTEGIRAALLSAGYLHPSDDLVADVRHMASEYVRSVAELRAAKDRALDLERRYAQLQKDAGLS